MYRQSHRRRHKVPKWHQHSTFCTSAAITRLFYAIAVMIQAVLSPLPAPTVIKPTTVSLVMPTSDVVIQFWNRFRNRIFIIISEILQSNLPRFPRWLTQGFCSSPSASGWTMATADLTQPLRRPLLLHCFRFRRLPPAHRWGQRRRQRTWRPSRLWRVLLSHWGAL